MPENYYQQLSSDVRFTEGLTGCLNCGTCTAICPAAEFYNYDPRIIVETVQSRDSEKIRELLSGEMIWYCGECMSCKTRCPRNNAPGLLIMALRALSVKTGLFTMSEKGRQQLVLKRTMGEWILKYGYCLYREEMTIEDHPEQGPTWEWQNSNLENLFERFDVKYRGDGPGPLRKIPDDALRELKRIFDVTGATDLFNFIEEQSAKKAEEMGLDFDNRLDCGYVHQIYNLDSGIHTREQVI
ncbi:MAG TPA: 4Fe-4S dicluster domain-containing protein [Bacteroidales bacterium]|nr:4Fe-4S dicluster domain-containing protein [Bacteroidales bacterium]